MLDLFKNIINRKTKDPKDSKDQKDNSDHSLLSPPSTNSQPNSFDSNTDSEDSKSNSTPSSINVLLEIQPELSAYYNELPPRYLLSEKIGEGAFSQVYKAYDSKESRYLAIKIIDKSKMQPDQLNSTLKEIAIMRQLNHPNIVKLYNYQNSSNSTYCFLFLEYLSGGEIFNQIIKYTYFSEDLTRHVLRQIAFAVKYLHDNGIVHRDIKPENLLFEPSPFTSRSTSDQLKARRKSDDENKVDEGKFSIQNGAGGIGKVKLADFGLSTLLQTSNSLAKTPCGTVGYTSPEQHMNIGYDKKVDMWAIGCVLYTMVVGFPPFYSNTQDANDITEKVLKGKYQFLKPWFDEVSDGCKNLITNLLTVDPSKRYSIDELLKDPWFNLGYEDDNLLRIKSKISSPAADAPKFAAFDTELFKTFSEDLINTSNVDDYFAGNKVNTEEGPIMTPRGEAIKLVFDTAKDFQRSTSSVANIKTIPKNNIMDVMCLNRNSKSASNSDSISDLETESDCSSCNENQPENQRSHRFDIPINISDTISIPNRSLKTHLQAMYEDDDQDEDDNNDDDDYDYDDDDDESLDSEDYDDSEGIEDDEDIDDYPITLTSLVKIKSPIIRRNHAIESATSSCLTPVHSRGTTLTLTAQTSCKTPSLKSHKSAKSIAIETTPTSNHPNHPNHSIHPIISIDNSIQPIIKSDTIYDNNDQISVNTSHTQTRKSSISFNVNPSIRSGSLTSNSSLSASSVTSATSESSGHIYKLANYENELTEVDENDTDNHININEPNSNERVKANKMCAVTNHLPHIHKLSHAEFRSKCQTHTPYIFKNKNECRSTTNIVEDTTSPGSDITVPLDNLSLEQKMSQHGIVNLQMNTSTILSRRKLKVEHVQ